MSQSCNSDQLNALLDFLDEHKELARGLLRTADGRARAKRLWEEITQLLNSLGGSVKTVQQWQKVWTDRKHSAKKNAAALRRVHTGTGGGPSSVSLSQWELKVLEIMGEGFGGPQTSARVPAFPTIDINEEVAQYSGSEPELSTPPIQLTFSESSIFASTSSNIGGVATVEISTEDAQGTIFPESLSSQTEQQRSGREEQYRESTHASSNITNRRTRRPSSGRPINNRISQRLLDMEREKIDILKNIDDRLSGIEKAIVELVKLKQNSPSNI